jgi:hypothetical protein
VKHQLDTSIPAYNDIHNRSRQAEPAAKVQKRVVVKTKEINRAVKRKRVPSNDNARYNSNVDLNHNLPPIVVKRIKFNDKTSNFLSSTVNDMSGIGFLDSSMAATKPKRFFKSGHHLDSMLDMSLPSNMPWNRKSTKKTKKRGYSFSGLPSKKQSQAPKVATPRKSTVTPKKQLVTARKPTVNPRKPVQHKTPRQGGAEAGGAESVMPAVPVQGDGPLEPSARRRQVVEQQGGGQRSIASLMEDWSDGEEEMGSKVTEVAVRSETIEGDGPLEPVAGGAPAQLTMEELDGLLVFAEAGLLMAAAAVGEEAEELWAGVGRVLGRL